MVAALPPGPARPRRKVLQSPPPVQPAPHGRGARRDGPLEGYYRHPAIHGRRIVFCSDDDLWTASDTGGIARRLTVSKAAVMRPVFSPDGQWIAFTGVDEGGSEV